MSSSSEFKCNLPVFVYPTTLNFYTNDTSSYKQVITLFNPYEFPIKFKVLCNAPKKYTVLDPEGLIKPKCCVDLVIRHIDVSVMNENITDKLRVQIFRLGNNNSSSSSSSTTTQSSSKSNTCIGKRDIPLTLLARKTNDSSFNDFNNPFQQGGGGGGGNSINSMFSFQPSPTNIQSQFTNTNQQQQQIRTENVNYLVIILGIICICLLFLPTVGDPSSSLPKYLHLTFEMKLFAAYILGMVTMAILRY